MTNESRAVPQVSLFVTRHSCVLGDSVVICCFWILVESTLRNLLQRFEQFAVLRLISNRMNVLIPDDSLFVDYEESTLGDPFAS